MDDTRTLKERIEQTIRQEVLARDPATQITVQRSALGWVRLRMVSHLFAGLDDEQREALVNKVLATLQLHLGMYPFAGYALLTPDELPTQPQAMPIQLPLWSEVLLAPEPIVAAEIEEAEGPLVVTFYSFKGGVGRSTAMAVTAGLLAEEGRRKVVMVDFDLEAPGLTVMLRPHEGEEARYGVLDYVYQRWLTPDQGFPDIADCIRRVGRGRSDLFLVPAGAYDEDYIHRLADFDVERFYHREPNPLHQLIQDLIAHLEPDVILIDARTGFDETSAVALFDLADLAVICFAPNEQSYRGLEWVIKAARKQKEAQGKPDLRFVLTPMPPVDKEKREEWLATADDQIAELWGLEADTAAEDLRAVVDYLPAIPVAEDLLTDLPESTRVNYKRIAEFIDAALPDLRPEVSAAGLRERVLPQLKFEAATADRIQVADIPKIFQRTADFPRFLADRTTLIRGAKGTGKSLLFRLFVEQGDTARQLAVPHADLERVQFVGAHGRQTLDEWILSSEDFASFEAQAGQESWRPLWAAYALLRLMYKIPELPLHDGESAQTLRTLTTEPGSHTALVLSLVNIVRQPESWPQLSDSLKDVNRWLAGQGRLVWLLYDELDVGFGHGAESYARRRRALEALLAWWLESGDVLTHIKIKCLLREDVWRSLAFPNKSHYTGRDMALQWQEVDLWRLVLRQALESSAFAEYVRNAFDLQPDNLEKPGVERLRQTLYPLWGERMGRGKKAFTHRWVLKRIADAQQNRFPRSLILLLERAAEIEKGLEATRQESILRPRALQDAMLHVSEKRVDEVRDEYPELKLALDALSGQSSPLSKDVLAERWRDLGENVDDLIDKMVQAGIFEKRPPARGEDTPRYAVAELYLSGLGLRRKGQR